MYVISTANLIQHVNHCMILLSFEHDLLSIHNMTVNPFSATAGYQKRIETKKATVIYRKKKKAKNVQESEIKSIINQMKSGDYKSFPRAVLDRYKHVRKDEFKLKSDIKCLPLWVESFSKEYSRLASHYKDIRNFNLEVS